MKIKKAIFPVAGLGTRFLPATKASPKEMLPIVDKPLIQYAVEEALAAGLREMIFITSSSKSAIIDHFDTNVGLEAQLAAAGKHDKLQLVRNILPANVTCSYVRQPRALGLGHAVLCARHLIGDEPFAVILADDLISDDDHGCVAQMTKAYEATNQSILAVQEIALAETKKYGVIEPGNRSTDKLIAIKHIVEKPAPAQAPSNLAAVGRYILTPAIFSCLEKIAIDNRGEIQLTDAIAMLLQQESVYAYQFTGKRYDCGSKLGYLQATIAYALKHPEIGDEFRDYLAAL